MANATSTAGVSSDHELSRPVESRHVTMITRGGGVGAGRFVGGSAASPFSISLLARVPTIESYGLLLKEK